MLPGISFSFFSTAIDHSPSSHSLCHYYLAKRKDEETKDEEEETKDEKEYDTKEKKVSFMGG